MRYTINYFKQLQCPRPNRIGEVRRGAYPGFVIFSDSKNCATHLSQIHQGESSNSASSGNCKHNRRGDGPLA